MAGGAFAANTPAEEPGPRGGQLALAIRQNLLIIPGNVFSGRDAHFRVCYAAEDRTIDRGAEILRRLARR